MKVLYRVLVLKFVVAKLLYVCCMARLKIFGFTIEGFLKLAIIKKKKEKIMALNPAFAGFDFICIRIIVINVSLILMALCLSGKIF